MNFYNWFCVLTTLCSSHMTSAGNGRKASPIVFPDEPVQRSMEFRQEIPLDLARKLSNVSEVEELFSNFIEDSTSVPFYGPLFTARFGGGPVERKAFKIAKVAGCTPEMTTVPLRPSTADASLYYFPPCTRVLRCGGCCSHDLLACQPVETEILQLGVQVTEYRGDQKLHFLKQELIPVEQHKKCKCGCRIKESDCKFGQKYREESCACECTNYDAREKCKSEFDLKIWNPNECACVCREFLDCSSGYYFDRFSCRCVPERPRKFNTTEFNRLNYQHIIT